MGGARGAGARDVRCAAAERGKANVTQHKTDRPSREGVRLLQVYGYRTGEQTSTSGSALQRPQSLQAGLSLHEGIIRAGEQYAVILRLASLRCTNCHAGKSTRGYLIAGRCGDQREKGDKGVVAPQKTPKNESAARPKRTSRITLT